MRTCIAMPRGAGHLGLAQPERGQRPPRGQLELQPDEVEPGHLLGHRVLHLQARIGLDEGEGRVLAAVGVDEEFDRGQIVEARRAGERHAPPRGSAPAARTPSPGAGAISISFWRWRWMLHSRSQRWVTPPDRSPATCTSMWRARGKSRST